jgi:very-short-patch-repair endonuclease
MRAEPTLAEETLWRALRGRRTGVRFRRQRAVGRFILDFYCPERALAVEVDGASHEGRVERDDERGRWLVSTGIRVLRVANADVMSNLQSVLDGIAFSLRAGSSDPPSPLRRGGRGVRSRGEGVGE